MIHYSPVLRERHYAPVQHQHYTLNAITRPFSQVSVGVLIDQLRNLLALRAVATSLMLEWRCGLTLTLLWLNAMQQIAGELSKSCTGKNSIITNTDYTVTTENNCSCDSFTSFHLPHSHIFILHNQRWSPRGRGLDLEAPRGRQMSALALKLKSLALVLASEPKFLVLALALAFSLAYQIKEQGIKRIGHEPAPEILATGTIWGE